MSVKAFPTYLDLKPVVPLWLWIFLRTAVLCLTGGVIYLLLTDPERGLTIFWKLVVPVLPAMFALAPGLWRNICPMATLNQLPRSTNIGFKKTLPGWCRNVALLVSIVLFASLVISRQLFLNDNAQLTATMIAVSLYFALLGGLLFKGRSGWCGTFCPLAPLQKIYGHAPLVNVRNGFL